MSSMLDVSSKSWVLRRDPRDDLPIAVYKKLDAECDKQPPVVGLLLTTLGQVYRRQCCKL